MSLVTRLLGSLRVSAGSEPRRRAGAETSPSFESLDAVLQWVPEMYLHGSDVLATLLHRLSRGSVARVLVGSMLLYGTTHLLLGYAISSYYLSRGVDLLPIWDPQSLIISALSALLFCPVIWTAYYWQVVAPGRALARLNENGVFARTTCGQEASQRLRATLGGTQHLSLVVTLVILSGCGFIYFSSTRTPENAYFFGRAEHWIFVNGVYFWLVYQPLWIVNAYMMLWVVIRQFHVAQVLWTVVDCFGIRPRVLLHDGCNGFGVVGAYSVRSGYLAVFVFLWWVALALYPMAFGGPLYRNEDTIVGLVIYLLVLPLVVLLPTWRMHEAMAGYKANVLNSIGDEIERVLDRHSGDDYAETAPRLQAAKERYAFYEKELREWPFRPFQVRGLSLSALMPLLSLAIGQIVKARTPTP